MPVNGVKGLWGGFVQGQQGAQTFTHNQKVQRGVDISNAKANAEFLHYVDTRKEAKKIMKGQASSAQTIIDSETSRLAMTQATNKSATADANINVATADQRQGVMEDQLTVQEQNAERMISMDAQLTKNAKVAAARAGMVDMMGMQTDQINFIAQVAAPVSADGMTIADVKPEQYSAVLNQLREAFGENSQKIFDQYGITEELSTNGLAVIQGINAAAVHNVDMQQEEHLVRMKGQIDLQIATAKATGTYDPESTMGKLLADQQHWIQVAGNSPVGSFMHKRANKSIDLLTGEINSLRRETEATADEKTADARTAQLTKDWPVLMADVAEGDAGAKEGLQTLTRVQDFLREVMPKEMADGMIQKWYSYEPDTAFTWGSTFKLTDDTSVLRESAREYQLMSEMLATAQTGQMYAQASDAELEKIFRDLQEIETQKILEERNSKKTQLEEQVRFQ